MSTRRKSKHTEESSSGAATKTKKAKVAISAPKKKRALTAAPCLTVPGRLQREFFDQDCEKLARALLGKLLVRIDDDGTRMSGIVVETEAYLGVSDPCCNTYGNRKTDHNAPMYGQAATAFVYMTYGMYYCFNVVCGRNGAAVLLRALEPREGLEAMRRRREAVRVARLQRRNAKANGQPSGKTEPEQKSAAELEAQWKLKELCNGPSKLCESLGINRDAHNSMDIGSSSTFFFEEASFGKFDTVATTRIGIRGPGSEWPLRFYVKGSQFVSKP